MPEFSGRIRLAKNIFNGIFSFINEFKYIAIKNRKGAESNILLQIFYYIYTIFIVKGILPRANIQKNAKDELYNKN